MDSEPPALAGDGAAEGAPEPKRRRPAPDDAVVRAQAANAADTKATAAFLSDARPRASLTLEEDCTRALLEDDEDPVEASSPEAGEGSDDGLFDSGPPGKMPSEPAAALLTLVGAPRGSSSGDEEVAEKDDAAKAGQKELHDWLVSLFPVPCDVSTPPG
mmetsp:Transcript_36326/g.102629  ORF Transcript_36326/g.102629 Transcript_36326/m.102629 type:complete len:159 (+) Transcript_36326:200-676(+)